MPAEEEPGDALFNAKHWENVRLLQWTLRSDGLITSAEAQRRIASLDRQGTLPRVKASMRSLVEALIAAYPSLGEERAQLTQLVALGQELTVSAADASDLYEFVKKELQPVDLVALLKL
jgi:hypothetical protein